MKGMYSLVLMREALKKLTACREPTEYMPMSDTYSPILHRLDQAVRWRAVHPIEPVPPPYEILTRYSKPPEGLVAKSKRQLEKLVAAADVKKGKSILHIKLTFVSLTTIQSHQNLNPENAIEMR